MKDKIRPLERDEADVKILPRSPLSAEVGIGNEDSQPHNFASHCHSIGEILTIGNQMGIVFCLDESRQHGKIVSADSSIKQWCSRKYYHFSTDQSYGLGKDNECHVIAVADF